MWDFRVQECKSTELVWANDETLHSGTVLDGTKHLLFTDTLYNPGQKKFAKHSGFDELPVSDMEGTAKLVMILLLPGGYAVVVCSAQQFATRRRLCVLLHPRNTIACLVFLSPSRRKGSWEGLQL